MGAFGSGGKVLIRTMENTRANWVRDIRKGTATDETKKKVAISPSVEEYQGKCSVKLDSKQYGEV